MLLHGDILVHGEVHAVVPEILEADLDAVGGIHDVAAVHILRLEGFQGFLDDGADLVHLDTVLHAHIEGHKFVGVIPREVLEVLVEQGGVREGHDRSVGSDDLGTLVGDAVHLAADAVALDEITHAQASGHELHPVEEVVQDILHRESETGRKTGADHLHGRRRNLQEDEDRDDIYAPQADADDVLRQREIGLVLMEEPPRGTFHDGTDLKQAINRLGQVHQIPEQEEQGHDQDDLGEGEVDIAFQIQERIRIVFVEYALQVEDAGSHVQAEGNGQDDRDGKERLLEEGMRPGDGDEVLVRPVREVAMLGDVPFLGSPDMSHIIDMDQVIYRRNGLK